ncbi:phBC6A51 family helix-turn-helix protein [Enterococcus faecium]|nr:phBC6A51 family helix-turn-helix protein [Enterococcus faecium]
MANPTGANNRMSAEMREQLMRECAIMMIIKRMKKAEIAKELGVSECTIGKWTLHDEKYAKIANEVAQRYFGDLVGDSIETIRKLVMSARSEKVRLEAAKDILDRAGLKPVDKLDASHDVNMEIVIGEWGEEEE